MKTRERGFILQPTYRIESGRPVVHLYGKLESGRPFLVRDTRQTPHFFVRASDTERARALGAAPLSRTGKVTFAGEQVVRVEAAVPADIPEIRERLIEAGVACFEADVRFALRGLVDRGIRGSLAIVGEPRGGGRGPGRAARATPGGAPPGTAPPNPGHGHPAQVRNDKGLCPGSSPDAQWQPTDAQGQPTDAQGQPTDAQGAPVPTAEGALSPAAGGSNGAETAPRGLVVFDEPEIEPDDWTPQLSVLAFDIETDPAAQRVLAISLHGCGASEVLLLNPGGAACPPGAVPFANERDLLRAFCRRVREIDPDVLTGWNVIDFDLSVLVRIAGRLGIALNPGRGPGGVRIQPARFLWGTSQASVPGRIVLDGIQLMRGAFIRREEFSLDAVARDVLGEGKTLAGHGRADEILRLFHEDRERFVEYNLTDSRLTLEIVRKLRLVELAVERSRLTGMPPDRVSASIAAFDFLYLSELSRRGIVAPTVRSANAAGGASSSDGAAGRDVTESASPTFAEADEARAAAAGAPPLARGAAEVEEIPPEFTAAAVRAEDAERAGAPPPDAGDLALESTMGGYVLEPEPGLYRRVLVFDFKSLYPSLIRTFQIDPLGHIPRRLASMGSGIASEAAAREERGVMTGESAPAEAEEAEVQARDLVGAPGPVRPIAEEPLLPYAPHADDAAGPARSSADDVIVAPNGAAFRREPGILPILLEELFPRREEAKRAGDHVKANAIKILMNSFYGVLGTPACRFASSEIANAITSFGREMLLWTKARIEEGGLRVLYGDTDSLFVLSDQGDPEAARRAGTALAARLDQELAAFIRKRWRVESRLELEFEELYLRLFLPHVRHGATGARKRYAGLVAGEGGAPRVVFTGLEVVRRDWTELAREVQRELYERLFADRAVDQYLRDVVEDLRAGRHDGKLIYRKSLRKSLGDYTAATPPHVVAARKMKRIEGRVIAYVITTSGPEPAAEASSPLDHEHYVQRQIRPIAEPVLEVLGGDFDRIVGDQRQLELF